MKWIELNMQKSWLIWGCLLFDLLHCNLIFYCNLGLWIVFDCSLFNIDHFTKYCYFIIKKNIMCPVLVLLLLVLIYIFHFDIFFYYKLLNYIILLLHLYILYCILSKKLHNILEYYYSCEMPCINVKYIHLTNLNYNHFI